MILESRPHFREFHSKRAVGAEIWPAFRLVLRIFLHFHFDVNLVQHCRTYKVNCVILASGRMHLNGIRTDLLGVFRLLRVLVVCLHTGHASKAAKRKSHQRNS